jgi:hypothetical protein
MALIDHLLSGSADHLVWLVDEVTREDKAREADHRAVLDWYVLGPRLALLFTGRELREPTFEEFLNLARVVEDRAPELSPLVEFLARCSPMSTVLAIKRLVEHDKPWAHPSQVLERPRPSPGALLKAYNLRARKGDSSTAFLAIRDRLRSAERVERSAAGRRARWARGRKDAVVRMGGGGKIAQWLLTQLPEGGLPRDGIIAGLRTAEISPEGLETAMHYLGVRAMSGGYCRLVDDFEFKSQRQAVAFVLEQVGGSHWKMSELAAVAYRNRLSLRITRQSFVVAARWLLETVEKDANRIAIIVEACWDGAATES